MAYLILFVLLLLLDQLSKWWAASALREAPLVLLSGFFELRYLENRGAAFGILQNAKGFFLLTTFLVLTALVFIVLRIPKAKEYRLLRVLICALAAGAVGNLIDRIFLSYVRDFLYFSLIDFPIFNVADIYVVVSVFVFLFCSFFLWKDEYFSFLKKEEPR